MHQRNNAILHKNINRLNILFARIIIFSFALAVSGCANPGNENHRGKTDAELVVCQFNMRFYKKDDGHISKSAGPSGKIIEKTDGTQTWEKRAPLFPARQLAFELVEFFDERARLRGRRRGEILLHPLDETGRNLLFHTDKYRQKQVKLCF